MKKISKELYKSYIGIIVVFFLSYMGLFYFFIGYIIRDTNLDLLSIDSFLKYELGGFERKLNEGKELKKLLDEALEECPKMPNTSVVFIFKEGVYPSYNEDIIEKMKDSEFSDEVQKQKSYYRKLEDGSIDINFTKIILLPLPDYQYIKKKIEIQNKTSFEVLIVKKLTQEKRVMLRVFRFTVALLILATLLSISISKKFYRDFTISLNTLQEFTNKINLENINSDLDTENRFIEFEKIINSYKKMLIRLKTQTESQIDFVNNASHELKTPIFIVGSYVNMMKRWGLENKKLLSEAIDSIGDEINVMASLVEKLLFLAKEDLGNIESKEIEIIELLKDIRRDMKRVYPEQKIEIVGKENKIYSDIYLLRQLLKNLVENAVKYGNGNEIKIEVNSDKNLKIEIIDRGIGIKKEDLEHIYDKFFRVDKSRSRKLGSHGLGMSIVKKIGDILKIDIEIESELGKGTKVILSIPNYTLVN